MWGPDLDWVRLADDVLWHPNVMFTNDWFTSSKAYSKSFARTDVGLGASIGGGRAVLLPGLLIGRSAMVGAGVVVTNAVPANAIVVGHPAVIVGDADGARSAPAHVHLRLMPLRQLGRGLGPSR